MSDSTPLNNCEQIKEKIAQLQESLRQGLPNYESLLHVIHVAIQKDDECAILLSPEEIGAICAGLSKKKGVVIATTTVKSAGKTAGGKKLKDVTLGDLGG